MNTAPRPPRPPIVEVAGATIRYGERAVVQDADLRLRAGERVALIGPNGAGKSTLLRAIAGLEPAGPGAIRLGGRPLEELDRLSIARRVAVVPQQVQLPFSARVEEVVGLGRLAHEDRLRGAGPADRAAVAAAIERVGLGHLLGRDVRRLSLGERQLVLLGVAVAQAAPVLLLDEPTVHLDLRHQVGAMELLADLNERDGTTILAVLHDVRLAAHFFPRIVMLDRGRIVADGPPDDVLTDDRIRDVFGVDPAVLHMGLGSPRNALTGGPAGDPAEALAEATMADRR